MSESTLIEVSAFSGLAGAVLTQLFSGVLSYLGDRRKQAMERGSQFRLKRAEIGENFYFMNGELMVMIKKNVEYWRNLRGDRGESALAFLRSEMEKLDAYQAKLNSENWKYNLVGIYFDVPFDFEQMLVANNRSHELYLRVIELSGIIRQMLPMERDALYAEYQGAVSALCDHYVAVYDNMKENMDAVKKQLLSDFSS